MTHEEFVRFVRNEEHKWTFAKTVPKNPHEYVVLFRVSEAHKALFKEARAFIKATGYTRVFAKIEYTYVDADGYRYWFGPFMFMNRAKGSVRDLPETDWVRDDDGHIA